MYRIRIKEVAVPNIPSREVSWWKNVGKTGINFLHLMYNIVSASKMAGETKPLSWKKVGELVVKYLPLQRQQ